MYAQQQLKLSLWKSGWALKRALRVWQWLYAPGSKLVHKHVKSTTVQVHPIHEVFLLHVLDFQYIVVVTIVGHVIADEFIGTVDQSGEVVFVAGSWEQFDDSDPRHLCAESQEPVDLQ